MSFSAPPRSSKRLIPVTLTALLAAGGLVLYPGCGSETRSFGNDGGPDFVGNGPNGPCRGLECQVPKCGVGTTTSVSGTVFAPNGTLPLYNVQVYVPNAPLAPIPEGVSCDRCGHVSGDPVTSALTDTRGRFTLQNVPAGKNVPLVIQVGKWRREIKIPEVQKCQDNPITDTSLTRLPKNRSEGHIPKIAVTTGECDHLACLLPKLGLDASEYSPTGGEGRLHLYKGALSAPAPAGTPGYDQLWNSVETLSRYDMIVLSCECEEYNETKSPAAKAALYNYASAGGRVFSSHYHYTWFRHSPVPAVKDVADWNPALSLTSGMPPYFVDTAFPKGQALADWLVNVGASQVKGQIPLNQVKGDVGAVKKGATRWVYSKDANGPEATQYLSFNAPIGVPADQQCGKVVFGDMHISGETNTWPNLTTLPDNGFPGTCPQGLTAAEKALIFFFFDLSSCVQDEAETPRPPIK